jgi:hypothetical protein
VTATGEEETHWRVGAGPAAESPLFEFLNSVFVVGCRVRQGFNDSEDAVDVGPDFLVLRIR